MKNRIQSPSSTPSKQKYRTPPRSTSAETKLAAHRTGGAATGALVGAVMGGPLGAVVGGAVGLLVGGASATPAIKKVTPSKKTKVVKKIRKVKAKAKRTVLKKVKRVKAKAKR